MVTIYPATMRAVLWIIFAASALAQPRGFEVASIKPASPTEIDAIKRSGRSTLFPEQGISISGNRVTVLGLTAATLIRVAFGLRADQFSGGPDWITSEPYNIAAEAETTLSFPQMRQMLQSLLTDRFQLKFHRDTKEGAGYALIVGKNGPKVQPSAIAEYSTHVNSGKSETQMTVAGATMTQFCGRLSTFLGRPVVDKTGLPGVYDLKLNFAQEIGEGEFPSIFTSVQKQLGLKLEAAKAPVEMLVIEGIQRPSEN